jgi:hypothetical protein
MRVNDRLTRVSMALLALTGALVLRAAGAPAAQGPLRLQLDPTDVHASSPTGCLIL